VASVSTRNDVVSRAATAGKSDTAIERAAATTSDRCSRGRGSGRDVPLLASSSSTPSSEMTTGGDGAGTRRDGGAGGVGAQYGDDDGA